MKVSKEKTFTEYEIDITVGDELTDMANADGEYAFKAANIQLCIYRTVIAFEILLIAVVVISAIKVK